VAYPNIWLVERYVPSRGRDDLKRLADETQAAVRMLRARDVEIFHLGSTLIPPDETCFCAFTAPTKQAIDQLNDFVEAPSLRIAAGVHLRSVEPLGPHSRWPPS
jgi:hypothetical protein